MKKQNGITLIALVITIIVLLILAGISISMVLSDNNILKKEEPAKTTINETEIEVYILNALNATDTDWESNGTGDKSTWYKSSGTKTFKAEIKKSGLNDGTITDYTEVSDNDTLIVKGTIQKDSNTNSKLYWKLENNEIKVQVTEF